MRTLKKTLALVLVVAMMMSLCITASAFEDADEIVNAEQVDVLVALGIIKGYEDNTFRPEGTLTRAEAAVMIARLLQADDITGDAPFTDLAGYEWAEDAIAYCYSEGIVDGIGDGKYDPAGKLTGYAWAKMLLCALGYDAETTGMTGASWQIGVAKLAKSTGIYGADVSDKTLACSRDAACAYAFNALFIEEVEYVSTGSDITIGDIEISSNKHLVELGTYLCEAFKLVSVDTTTDDGLNGHYWTVNKKAATDVYVDDVLVGTYGAGTSVKAIVAALGENAKSTETVAYYANGVQKGDVVGIASYVNDTTKVPAGVVVNVYVDADGNYKAMATVEYVVAANKPVKVTDKNSDNYGKYAWTFGSYTDAVIYAGAEDYTEGAMYLVVPQGDNTAATKYLSHEAAESVQGKISAKGNGYVRIGTDKYNLAGEYAGAAMTVGNEYVLYLASDGSVLAAVVPAAAVDTTETLVYVVAYYSKNVPAVPAEYDAYGQLIKGTGIPAYVESYAQGVNMDGEEVSYLVAAGDYAVVGMTDCIKAVKYDASNELYSLVDAKTATSLKLNDKKISVDGYYYNNAEYVSIVGALDKLAISAGSLKAAAADDNAWVVFSTNANSSNKTVSKVFYWAPAVVVDTTYSYAIAATGADYIEEGAILKKNATVATPVYTYEVYINGEATEIQTYTATLDRDFYKYAVDEYGVYTLVELDGYEAVVTNVYGDYISTADYTDYNVAGIPVVDLTVDGNGVIDTGDTIALYAIDNGNGTYTIECIYIVG